MTLAIERLTAAELHSLDVAQTVEALFEIAAELLALGRLGQDMRLHVTACKKSVRHNRHDAEAACRLLDAQATFDNLKDRVRTLKELKSTLQTVLRANG